MSLVMGKLVFVMCKCHNGAYLSVGIYIYIYIYIYTSQNLIRATQCKFPLQNVQFSCKI